MYLVAGRTETGNGGHCRNYLQGYGVCCSLLDKLIFCTYFMLDVIASNGFLFFFESRISLTLTVSCSSVVKQMKADLKVRFGRQFYFVRVRTSVEVFRCRFLGF
jgi:hypothetical protein